MCHTESSGAERCEVSVKRSGASVLAPSVKRPRLALVSAAARQQSSIGGRGHKADVSADRLAVGFQERLPRDEAGSARIPSDPLLLTIDPGCFVVAALFRERCACRSPGKGTDLVLTTEAGGGHVPSRIVRPAVEEGVDVA